MLSFLRFRQRAPTKTVTWTCSLSTGWQTVFTLFLDLPFGLTDSQVLAMIGSSNQATQEDTNLWQTYYSQASPAGITASTVVSYKPDGTYNIQRFSSNQDSYLSHNEHNQRSGGIGDLNFDGSCQLQQISGLFSTIVQSNNTQFNRQPPM